MSDRTLPELLDALIHISTEIGFCEDRLSTAEDHAGHAEAQDERDAIRAEIIARFGPGEGARQPDAILDYRPS